MSARFAAAFAEGDPATLARQLLPRSCPKNGAPRSACCMSASRPRSALPQLVRELAEATGTAAWVGGVGLGVCAAGKRGP